VYIVILGAGDVGLNLAKMLSYERHDIVLIENNVENFTRASDLLDAQVILGTGSSFKTLEKAGIKSADMLVAVTNSDEVNLLAALMAKSYGVKQPKVQSGCLSRARLRILLSSLMARLF